MMAVFLGFLEVYDECKIYLFLLCSQNAVKIFPRQEKFMNLFLFWETGIFAFLLQDFPGLVIHNPSKTH